MFSLYLLAPDDLVTPEPSPRIQALRVTQVGDPSAALRVLAERMLALAAWPADLEVADGADLDRDSVLRALRAGGARFGAMTLGLPTEGDGRTMTTLDLLTERGGATLTVGLDPDSGAVTTVALCARERSAPAEPW